MVEKSDLCELPSIIAHEAVYHSPVEWLSAVTYIHRRPRFVTEPAASLWYDGPFPALAVRVLIGWAASGVFPLFMAPTVAGWSADRYCLKTPPLTELACTLIASALRGQRSAISPVSSITL